jgi:hypothetical protein
MWTCPRCGRAFANRNQLHACGAWTLDEHLRTASAEVAPLVRRFVELVELCGPFALAPTKTRIGFKVRMTFAALTPRRRWLDGHVVLRRRLDHPRFRRIDSLGPRTHVHHFRLYSLEELDDEVLDWVRESYAAGEQRALAAPARSDAGRRRRA